MEKTLPFLATLRYRAGTVGWAELLGSERAGRVIVSPERIAEFERSMGAADGGGGVLASDGPCKLGGGGGAAMLLDGEAGGVTGEGGERRRPVGLTVVMVRQCRCLVSPPPSWRRHRLTLRSSGAGATRQWEIHAVPGSAGRARRAVGQSGADSCQAFPCQAFPYQAFPFAKRFLKLSAYLY